MVPTFHPTKPFLSSPLSPSPFIFLSTIIGAGKPVFTVVLTQILDLSCLSKKLIKINFVGGESEQARFQKTSNRCLHEAKNFFENF